MKIALILSLTLLTLFKIEPSTQKAVDQRLYNTWLSYQEGELLGIVLNRDNSLEFFYGNINTYDLRNRRDELYCTYEIIEGSINRIDLKFKMVDSHQERSLELNGIYEFVNDTQLKLDFQVPGDPLLEKFTDSTIIFSSDPDEVASMAIDENIKKDIIYSYVSNDKWFTDTIKISDPNYIQMDSFFYHLQNGKFDRFIENN